MRHVPIKDVLFAVTNLKKNNVMSKAIIKVLKADLEDNKNSLAEYNKLREFLTPFDGKSIDGYFSKKLPKEWKLERKYGMSHILINDNSHLIGYDSDNYIRMDKLENFDSCHSIGASDRIKKLEDILSNPEKLDRLVKMLTKLIKSFNAFKQCCNDYYKGEFESYKNPSFYSLLREFKIPSTLVSDVYFNKL